VRCAAPLWIRQANVKLSFSPCTLTISFVVLIVGTECEFFVIDNCRLPFVDDSGVGCHEGRVGTTRSTCGRPRFIRLAVQRPASVWRFRGL